MIMPRAAEPKSLPLLVWTEQAEIDRLQQRRLELQGRILGLPRHSHRRVELEARLRAVTERQLELQTTIGRSL